MTKITLFQIVRQWMVVSDADIQLFKDALYKAFPNASKETIAPTWTKPGPFECCEDNCMGRVRIVDKYWLVFPESKEIYTINDKNEFGKDEDRC